MNDPSTITNLYAFLGLVAIQLTTLVTALFQWYAKRENKQLMDAATAKVDQVAVQVNGRTAELVKAAHAIGYLEGLAAATKTERAVAADLVTEHAAAAVTALAVTVAAGQRPEGEGVHP